MTQSYPSYKPTPIPWLPQIPEHWNVRKAKHLFKERSEKGYPNEPLLAATQTKGVVFKEDYETRTVTAQKDFHLLKLVKKEDFVISLRSFQGGIEFAHQQGIISPAYTVFREKNNKEVDKGFYRHLFKSNPFISSLTLFVTGIREGQNIEYGEFKDSLLPLPPLPEQTAIANYLDSKTDEINTFIAKKEKLIALLKEQKQAIINNVIKKGANKSAKLKMSGVEWLGEIPDHWKINKLSRLCYKIGDGLHGTPDYHDGTKLYFINGNNLVNGNIEIFSDTKEVSKESYFSNKKEIRKGTVLLSINGSIGNHAIYNEGSFLLGKSAAYFDCRPEIFNEFLEKIFQSFDLISYFLSTTENTTIKNLSLETLRNTQIPLPPIEEQIEIVKYLNNEELKLSTAINRVEKEIELVKELKQSLIAEVVTGKIKIT